MRVAIAVGLVCLSHGFAAARPRGPAPTSAKSAKFDRWLGRDTMAILRAPDRVEAFAVRTWRVGHPPAGKSDHDPAHVLPPGTPRDIAEHAIYAVGTAQPADFARRLVAVLLDASSYTEGMLPFDTRVIKGCVFMPGAAFRIWSGKAAVDVLLCFSCDQVGIVPVARRTTDWGLVFGDIDPARAALVTLAKQALGGVPAIAKLPEVRPEERQGDRQR